MPCYKCLSRAPARFVTIGPGNTDLRRKVIERSCRAPPLPLAALLSPVLWRLNNPDRFDMYSVGVILMQLAFAPLRADSGLIAFNKRLEELNWDLGKWRAETARKKTSGFAEGFRIMDAEGGAAWELACGVRTPTPAPPQEGRSALRGALCRQQSATSAVAVSKHQQAQRNRVCGTQQYLRCR